jgi:hypothetical protein
MNGQQSRLLSSVKTATRNGQRFGTSIVAADHPLSAFEYTPVTMWKARHFSHCAYRPGRP